MDRIAWAKLVVAVLVVSAVAPTGTVGAAEEAPDITVEVNGEHLSDGDRVVVDDANLTVRADAAEELSSVVIRVGGEELGPFYPDGSSYEKTIDPDLHGEDNEIRVIATDDADQTSSYRATVYRDSIAPHIGLSDPFSVEPGHAFPANHTVDAVNVSLNGTVADESNITDFEARIEGEDTVQTTHLANDSSFELNTTLGLGTSNLTIQATDEYGNERRARTMLIVEDEADPTIEVRGWRDESRQPVTVQVRARDDVGLHSVTVDPERKPQRDLIEPSYELFDKGRHDVERNVTLDFRYESVYNVTFTAKDVTNKTTTVEKTIAYDPISEAEAAAPDIEVNENESGIVNDGTYLLDAAATNGSITKVTVESETVPDGNVTDHSVVYDGPERSNVTIYERIPLEEGRNRIQIRATDTFGVEHERTIRVDSNDDSQWIATTTSSSNDTTTTNGSSTTTSANTTTHPGVEVSPVEEDPLTPASKTSVPLSPLLVVLAIVVTAISLARRSKLE